MRELRVPSDADDSAIQETLMRLFSAQVQHQSETVAEEGQAVKAQRSVEDQVLKAKRSETDSDQALKASVSTSVQFRSDQPETESKSPSLVQLKPDVSVSSSGGQDSQCTLAVGRSSIQIDNSLRDRICSLLQKEILHKQILEEMESTGKNELIRGQEKVQNTEKLLMIHVTRQPKEV